MASDTAALLKRTVGCGEIGEDDARSDREVVLTGWVHRRRDLGQLIFVELRDQSGMVQIVVDPSDSPAAHAAGQLLSWPRGIRPTAALPRRRLCRHRVPPCPIPRPPPQDGALPRQSTVPPPLHPR